MFQGLKLRVKVKVKVRLGVSYDLLELRVGVRGGLKFALGLFVQGEG